MSVFGVILVRIFPVFSRVGTEYGEIRSVFNPNAGKYGENADQNNSEYRHFLSTVLWCHTLWEFMKTFFSFLMQPVQTEHAPLMTLKPKQ